MIKKYFLVVFLFFQSLQLFAGDYHAAVFNIYSDGVTMNTRSIQFAIDYISGQGGGRLIFDVGRYLTGSFELKSNVTLQLEKGAEILGALNPLDYEKRQWTALVFAYGQHDIGISGEGIIDGQGQLVARNVVNLIAKGFMKDPLGEGRPEATSRPVIINFHDCQRILVRGITLKNSSSWVEVYDHCKELAIDSIHVDSKDYWNNDGIDIVDCQDVSVTNSFIDSDDDGVCLKSFDAKNISTHILIRDCVIRSSANGIKFGTSSYGVFTDVHVLHNTVYNTYRSAIALEAVDGGTIENVEVDSLDARHSGNLIFLRIGERVAGKKGHLRKISLSHLKADIPPGKPDAGYPYEGPVEDGPRNVSPAIIIAGLPDADISDISISHVEIRHPGGGDSSYAKVSLDSLGSIPEYPAHYPEFSMFRELPAWGMFIRHARNLNFSDIDLRCLKGDFRVPVVLDDVHDAAFSSLRVNQPDKAKYVFRYQSDAVSIK